MDLPFGWWTRVGWKKQNFKRIRQMVPVCHMGRHIGATWRILMNRPSSATMWSYVTLLWPLVIFTVTSVVFWVIMGECGCGRVLPRPNVDRRRQCGQLDRDAAVPALAPVQTACRAVLAVRWWQSPAADDRPVDCRATDTRPRQQRHVRFHQQGTHCCLQQPAVWNVRHQRGRRKSRWHASDVSIINCSWSCLKHLM